MDGRPARAKKLIGIGTGFGPAKGAPMPLLVLIPRKTLRVNFCIGKILFILEIRRDNGVLCLLVITRGLPDSLGFGDTW
jgi:hypothetical protein